MAGVWVAGDENKQRGVAVRFAPGAQWHDGHDDNRMRVPVSLYHSRHALRARDDSALPPTRGPCDRE